jgi:hypothetical protein
MRDEKVSRLQVFVYNGGSRVLTRPRDGWLGACRLMAKADA